MYYIIELIKLFFISIFYPKNNKSTYKNVDWHNGENKLKELLPPKTEDTYAIIGCGFLGRWLLYFLLYRGERNILCADIIEPDLTEFTEKFGKDSIKFVKCDITNYHNVEEILHNIDTVFLTSALIMYHQCQDFQYPMSYNVNVIGTQNVIKTCQKLRVKRLIQTSTSHVCVGDDLDPNIIMNEDTPYTQKPLDHYTKTKILAEKLILDVSKEDKLKTIIIRPCSGIFGYQDRHLTEKSFETLKCRALVVNNIIDFVYVENVCLGHLLAESKLRKDSSISGEIFCISNDKPMKGIDFYSILCYYYPEIKLKIPPRFILNIVAFISEKIQWLRYITNCKWNLGEIEFLTPPTMQLTSLSYRFGIEKARKILKYEPAYTVEEGLKKTIEMNISNKLNRLS